MTKVTLEANTESMAPLRGFAYAMSLSAPVGKEDFLTIHRVINAKTQSPTDDAKSKAKAKAAAAKTGAAPKGSASASRKAKAYPPVPPFAPSEPEVKVEEPPAKRARPSHIESMDPNLSGNMAAHMAESDKQWGKETIGRFETLLCLSPRESDAEFRADVVEVVKQVNGLAGQIRAKKRSANRREEHNKLSLFKTADALLENCVAYADFLKAIQKNEGGPGTGDELQRQYMDLLKHKAVFGCEIPKRVTKRVVLDDIGYQRWTSLISKTWAFVKENISKDVAANFFFQQLTVALQKLLKSNDGNDGRPSATRLSLNLWERLGTGNVYVVSDQVITDQWYEQYFSPINYHYHYHLSLSYMSLITLITLITDHQQYWSVVDDD